jgi:multiple sugar transport system ATP-binding protein
LAWVFGVAFADVTKSWADDPPALDHLNLTVEPGEFVSLVGPSGCGKTTALRILGGLESPTSGRVYLGGRDITALPTRDRNFGLVTQQNQLIKHLTAARNIKFPLEMRDPEGDHGSFDDRLAGEARALGITHLLDRSPKHMSEGERRIVQLARAVIGTPSTLLLDEPFGYLEDQVRLRLRGDIMRIHADRGLTSLMVTASQHDAMAMSDRIVVLFDGVVHQIGTPRDVYERPATSRVARFFGEPPMNVVPAPVTAGGGGRQVEILGRSVPVWTPLVDAYHGRTVLVGFRPEDVVAGEAADVGIEVRVRATEPLGRMTLVEGVTRDGVRIDCTVPGAPPPLGLTLDLGLRPDRIHLFDPATELAVLHPATVG